MPDKKSPRVKPGKADQTFNVISFYRLGISNQKSNAINNTRKFKK
jgi:hypothetical protein